MTTFYPGPSKLYPQVEQYMIEACDSGILSANHRSPAFMEMCKKTLTLLHQKLNIPADYTIVFVSSATECWEVIAQSFTQKKSFHFYNGAFGKKWFTYTCRLRPDASAAVADLNGSLFALAGQLPPPSEMHLADAEVICLTHNETSNGTQIPVADLVHLRHMFDNQLIAVDATSSLAGADLPIGSADLWFASVQKCLGLPAGLGLLIVSPQAIERARQINDTQFYNSFGFMHENMQNFQTHYTPNVLGIYLLMRVLDQLENVTLVDARIRQQAADWYAFFDNHPVLNPLVAYVPVRSDTVITVSASAEIVSWVKQKATAAGITLGNGYGDWKSSTFRIANFPAITPEEINGLMALLRE